MKSMTGYGRGESGDCNRSIVIELKGVNHRFLDICIRAPKLFTQFEDLIRKCLQQDIERGRVDVFLSYTDMLPESNCYKANIEKAKSFLCSAATLSRELGLEDDITLSSLLSSADFIELSEAKADDDLELILIKALTAAIESFDQMRKTEGRALAEDLSEKIQSIDNAVGCILKEAPRVVVDYREKLLSRVNELGQEISFDEKRIEEEIALFCDKSCIDEELTRLQSHSKELKKLVLSDGAVGRKLDFLLQEMFRETNTIGSKANNLEITKNVLSLKNDIEKIREQAQNIE